MKSTDPCSLTRYLWHESTSASTSRYVSLLEGNMQASSYTKKYTWPDSILISAPVPSQKRRTNAGGRQFRFMWIGIHRQLRWGERALRGFAGGSREGPDEQRVP